MKRGERRRKEKMEELGETLWNAACMVKRGKKFKTPDGHQSGITTSSLKASTPITSNPNLFSFKNNDNVVLMTWMKTNPV